MIRKLKIMRDSFKEPNAEFGTVSTNITSRKKVIRHYEGLLGIFNKIPTTYLKDS